MFGKTQITIPESNSALLSIPNSNPQRDLNYSNPNIQRLEGSNVSIMIAGGGRGGVWRKAPAQKEVLATGVDKVCVGNGAESLQLGES